MHISRDGKLPGRSSWRLDFQKENNGLFCLNGSIKAKYWWAGLPRKQALMSHLLFSYNSKVKRFFFQGRTTNKSEEWDNPPSRVSPTKAGNLRAPGSVLSFLDHSPSPRVVWDTGERGTTLHEKIDISIPARQEDRIIMLLLLRKESFAHLWWAKIRGCLGICFPANIFY